VTFPERIGSSFRFIVLFSIPFVLIFLVGFEWLWNNKVEMNRISGNGIVEATEIEISSKVAGKLKVLIPNEGDRLKMGQEIATLEADELEGQLQAARGGLKTAEARLAELLAGTRKEEIQRAQAQLRAAIFGLKQAHARRKLVHAGPRKEQIEQLRAGLAQAKSNLVDAERELKRMEKLEKEGAAPGQQYDLALTRRNIAKAQVKAAEQKLLEAETGARSQELDEIDAFEEAAKAQVEAASAALDLALAGPRPEVVEAARGAVEQARGLLRTAEAALANTRILCPSDGTVTLRNAEPGEFITPGLPILRIARLDKVWLKVYVPEPEVGRIKLGDKAEIKPDSTEKTFPGKVVEIAEKPEFTPKNVQTKAERTKLVFGIKLEVENSEQIFKPGMPADAVIFVDK